MQEVFSCSPIYRPHRQNRKAFIILSLAVEAAKSGADLAIHIGQIARCHVLRYRAGTGETAFREPGDGLRGDGCAW